MSSFTYDLWKYWIFIETDKTNAINVKFTHVTNLHKYNSYLFYFLIQLPPIILKSLIN